MKSDHSRRILTAIAAFAIFAVGLLTPANYYISLLIIVGVTVPILLETWVLMGMPWPDRVLACLLVVSALAQITMGIPNLAWTVLVLVGGVMALSVVTMLDGIEQSRRRLSAAFFCLITVSLPLGSIGLLRMVEHGGKLVWFLLCVACFSDIGALYTGRYFGKHKLAPRISPKKTREGSIGGVLAAVAAVVVWALILKAMGRDGVLWLADSPSAWVEIVAITVLVTVISQVGDLAESMLKRDAGVKDSGSNTTGHGGFLDMADAVLWAGPATYVYAVFRGFN